MPKKNGKNLSCVICGDTFYAAKKQIYKGRKYCSLPCYWEYLRLNPLKYWEGKKRSSPTAETRLKLSKALIGKKRGPMSAELRKQLSEARKGKYCGDKHPRWKGGKSSSCGRPLVISKDHPNKHHGSYIYESRAVMEKHIGRILARIEIVHHINLDKADNRIENLMLFPDSSSHTKYHWYLKGK